MIYVIIILAILALIIFGIARAASGDHYSKMTEEEFETEAKRSSSIGSAVTGLQKIIDPSHHVEYAEEQQQRIEADGTELGDKPEAGQKK